MEPLSVQGGRHDCCSAPAIAAPVAHSVRACQHRLPHALAQTSWVSQGGESPSPPAPWRGLVGGRPYPSIEPSAGGRLAKVTAQSSTPRGNAPALPISWAGENARRLPRSLAKTSHQPRLPPRPRARDRSPPGNGPYHFRLTDLPGRPSWPPRRCRRLRPRRQSKDRRGGSEQPKPKSRRIACQYGSHSGGSQTGDRNAMGGGERVRVGGREPWAAARLCFCAGRRPGLNAGYLCHLCLGNLWAVEPPAVAPTNRQRGGSPGGCPRGYPRGYPRDTQGIAAAFCRAGTHLAEPCASRALHI